MRIISRKDAKAPRYAKPNQDDTHESGRFPGAAISVAGFEFNGILGHRTATFAENDQSDTDGH
ncbi:MAG: hypothetical protein DMF73_04190 [Acidobacteria bacterium]|nr:MAG: hypothetical protein DMF73_04190 [Acidobacteriota bacterium]